MYAFDVQESALAATRSRLQQAGLLPRVTLIADSHVNMQHHIAPGLQAAVFNLGYLPGNNKTVTTHASSTLAALEQMLDLLRPGGIVVLVVYCAHPGGNEESNAVLNWVQALDARQAVAVRYNLVNQDGSPPYVLALEKRSHALPS